MGEAAGQTDVHRAVGPKCRPGRGRVWAEDCLYRAPARFMPYLSCPAVDIEFVRAEIADGYREALKQSAQRSWRDNPMTRMSEVRRGSSCARRQHRGSTMIARKQLAKGDEGDCAKGETYTAPFIAASGRDAGFATVTWRNGSKRTPMAIGQSVDTMTSTGASDVGTEQHISISYGKSPTATVKRVRPPMSDTITCGNRAGLA